jgi:hypothetical protein
LEKKKIRKVKNQTENKNLIDDFDLLLSYMDIGNIAYLFKISNHQTKPTGIIRDLEYRKLNSYALQIGILIDNLSVKDIKKMNTVFDLLRIEEHKLTETVTI